MTIEQRVENLNKIKLALECVFAESLLSAIVYGSTLNDDFCITSDYDLLLIFKTSNFDTFKKLRQIKADFLSEGISIDFNVQHLNELASVRQELFWHNNRGLYVRKELALYGKVLIGENLFPDCDIDNDLMLIEAVRVINSMNYQARKLFINKDITLNTNKILIIKWCIYASLYALAARGIYPKDRKTALEKFVKEFNPQIDPNIFLRIKIQRPDSITLEDMKIAYDFLNYLNNFIFAEYKERKDK